MLTVDDYIKFPITKEMYKRASSRAKSLGVLKNSITKGEGNLAGFLAEDVVRNLLEGKYSCGDSKYNHDIIINNKTIEIKSKRRTVPPLINYEVSVAETSRHQSPDFYVFASVSNDIVWVIGYISLLDFIKRSRKINKGTIDKTNNFKAHTNMYNLYHYELNPISELKNEISITST